MLEINYLELKQELNNLTRFVLRPDLTITVTNLRTKQKIENDEENRFLTYIIEEDEDQQNKKNNNKENGFKFGQQARRRLKNYVISAAINGHLDNKNCFFATFTFTNSKVIKDYKADEHDDLLVKTFIKFLNNLKINHGLREYVWVAERHTGKRAKKKQKGQKSKKGWLHFHSILVFDNYFDVQLLNYLWLKRINNEKNLQCEFSTNETLKNTINNIKNNYKDIFNNNYNKYNNNNNTNYFIDNNPNDYVQNIQKAHEKNKIKIASNKAFKNNDIKEIKKLSKFWLNPVDVEFFGYDNKKVKLSKSQTLIKVINYVTTYIQKAETEEKEGKKEEKKEIKKIYSRIWSASRLFTNQKHKTNITLEEAQELIENNLVKIIKTEKEIEYKKTGEIFMVNFYTVLLDYKIYNNNNFLNYFKNEKDLFYNKQDFG